VIGKGLLEDSWHCVLSSVKIPPRQPDAPSQKDKLKVKYLKRAIEKSLHDTEYLYLFFLPDEYAYNNLHNLVKKKPALLLFVLCFYLLIIK
jgi:hypothetical protein